MNDSPQENRPKDPLHSDIIQRIKEAGAAEVQLPPDTHPLLREWFAQSQAASHMTELIKDVSGRVSGVFAREPHPVFITDPSHGEVLAQRHQTLNVKQLVLELGLSGTPKERSILEQKILNDGGFLQDYNDAFEAARIEQRITDLNGGGWLIVESRGGLTRKDFTPGPVVAGGDIQVKVPSVRARGVVEEVRLEPNVKGKHEGNRIETNAEELVQEILQHPAMVVWIADVCSLRGSEAFGKEFLPPLKFARTASEKVFEEIRAINARRKIPLQWALSAIAEVTHILTRRKKLLHLFNPTLLNQRGLELTRRNRSRKAGGVYRNIYLGQQVGRLMKVELPAGDSGYLQLNWHIAAQEIWKPEDAKEELLER